MSVDESTLTLWKYNATGWSEVPGSEVDTIANLVSANITSFSIFAPLGAPSTYATCDNETAWFETTYGVSINVGYAGNNQTINITGGNKTVAIHVLCHTLTCGELVDLLNGLDLATFQSLPEIIELDYCNSVHYRTWLNRTEYESNATADLTVFNLDLLVGNGSLARPDLNISGNSSGGDNDNCTDERVIVGACELTKLVQSYEGTDPGFNQVNISAGSTTVQYLANNSDLLLAVNFTDLLDAPQGIFMENVAAVDVVTAYGSSSVWWNDTPKLST